MKLEILRDDSLSLKARRRLFKESSDIDADFIVDLLCDMLRRRVFAVERGRRLFIRLLAKSRNLEAQKRIIATPDNFALIFAADRRSDAASVENDATAAAARS